MPKDKSKTLEKIIPAAKSEFLEKGFTGASMRSIAARADMSAAGLYCHFENKEAMFEALVSPVYSELIRRYNAQSDIYFEQLENVGMGKMFDASGKTMAIFVEYIYDNLDEFRLLISCSEQTPYEHFTHALVDLEVEMSINYIAKAKALGYEVNDISREEIHIIASAMFSCIYEIVLHEIPKKKGIRMAEQFSSFFAAGWKDLLLK